MRIHRGEHGSVDTLVNNAGLLSNHKAERTSPQEWRRLMAVNLDGAFYLARALLPGMRKAGFGRVVNVCSLAMKTGGLTAGTAYTASKGGLGALTFSLCARGRGAGRDRQRRGAGLRANPHGHRAALERAAPGAAPADSGRALLRAGGSCGTHRISGLAARGIHHRRDHRHQRRTTHGLARLATDRRRMSGTEHRIPGSAGVPPT